MSLDYSKLWEATYKEILEKALGILKADGKDIAGELRPFVENIAKWSADYAVDAIKGDQNAQKHIVMLEHQIGLIGALVSQQGRETFQTLVSEIVPIVVRVLVVVLTAVL